MEIFHRTTKIIRVSFLLLSIQIHMLRLFLTYFLQISFIPWLCLLLCSQAMGAGGGGGKPSVCQPPNWIFFFGKSKLKKNKEIYQILVPFFLMLFCPEYKSSLNRTGWSWGIAQGLFREALPSNLSRESDYLHWGFFWFSSVSPAEILPQLGHDCFLPNPFQFIIQPTTQHCTV
jgi:hypothetical protein